MSAALEVFAHLDPLTQTINVECPVRNQTSDTWAAHGSTVLGWQLFDPETDLFIAEGEWQPLPISLPPRQTATVAIRVRIPDVPGRYHAYLSTQDASHGWAYRRGEQFVLLEIDIQPRTPPRFTALLTSLPRIRRRKLRGLWRKTFIDPLVVIWRNRSLIRAMVERDILVRYRGSAAGFLWTVLNPLLLMITYFFVFGVVLQTRFGADTSRSGFVLYFLAGMLPWLAFSEAVGRSPGIVIENGNLVKKLVFPVETLPVNLVSSGLITQCIGTVIFLMGLYIIRGYLPTTALWLPALILPQVLFTLGISWTLSALGVFFRDLGQLMGFLLTTLFFMTPICYPETSLPAGIAPLLTRNPLYMLVRGYRMIFLENRAPDVLLTAKLWGISVLLFFLGYAIFYKLRKSFADVL